MGDEQPSEYDFLASMQEKMDLLQNQNQQLATELSTQMTEKRHTGNVVEVQLDNSALLQRLEHFLKGDYISKDNEGNEYWAKQKDTDLVLLNEYGVNFVLSRVDLYTDKTALSNLDELRINEICADLGDELASEMFCTYEQMGLNTNTKKTRYRGIVLSILHRVELELRRALFGKTSENLNQAHIITGTENRLASPPLMMQNKPKFNVLNPRTW